MTTLTLILTLRPHDAIIIYEDKQQSAISEVDLKSKVGCFCPSRLKSFWVQVVDLKSTWGHFCTKWGRIGTLKSLPGLFGVLGFRPYWCPSPFPSPSILGVFHSLLSAIGFQSCFFFTADVSPPIRSTLHLLTF